MNEQVQPTLELKPCPFCGHKGQGPIMYDSEWWVACGNQKCWIHDFKTSEEEAAEAWNTRPVEDRLLAEVARLNVEVERLKRLVK